MKVDGRVYRGPNANFNASTQQSLISSARPDDTVSKQSATDLTRPSGSFQSFRDVRVSSPASLVIAGLCVVRYNHREGSSGIANTGVSRELAELAPCQARRRRYQVEEEGTWKRRGLERVKGVPM